MFLDSTISRLNAGNIITLACDIETRNRLITCIGFADSPSHAIVIPCFAKTKDGFGSAFPPTGEAQITKLLCNLLTHPNVRLVGQNFLYDAYYFWHTWGIVVKCFFDTMIAQHLLFPGTPKGLGYLSSLHCHYHRYWKDDNHEWDAKIDMQEHFLYNAEDCIRTFEIYESLSTTLTATGMRKLWGEEMEKNEVAFEMSRKGLRIDTSRRNQLHMELSEAELARQQFLIKTIPQEWVQPGADVFWYSSPSQQKIVFYEILGMAPLLHRKTKKVTLDKEAIPKLRSRYREFAPIFDALLELRSIQVFKNTFILAALSSDSRFRATFNPAGTETFRWSSSHTPLGEGTNLQNIPKGSKE